MAAHGCNTHTQRAAAQAAWSRRHGWRHRALWRRCRNSVPNGQAPPGSKAVVRNTQPPGVLRSKASKHRARDAGEKADLRVFSDRTPVSAEIGVPLRCGDVSELRGSVGPRGVPRALGLFSKAPRPNHSDAKRIARAMEACLKTETARFAMARGQRLLIRTPHQRHRHSGESALAATAQFPNGQTKSPANGPGFAYSTQRSTRTNYLLGVAFAT